MAENKHRVILDERSSLMLNGVSNVDSFADEHIELSGSFGGLDIEAVSYTHLDVYKRQRLLLSRRIKTR